MVACLRLLFLLLRFCVKKAGMKNLLIAAIFGSTFFLNGVAFAGDDASVWSPDRNFYVRAFYFNPPSKSESNKGVEREKLIVYSAAGKEVATAHIWLVEPDGTMRAGIRGCESFGWLDLTRIFCKGTINPHQSIELIFDAQTGHELQEIDPDKTP